MAPYVANHPELYRVVDLTDVISTEVGRSLPYRGALSRLLYMLERPRIARYERWVAENFEETWLISAADRDVLTRACPTANIQVITNGVDIDTLHPTGADPVPGRLIFVGHMGVFHNIDAAEVLARDVLPLVRRLIPAASLQIVGADPALRVQQLGSIPSVEVAGFVPDLNAALNQAAVFVAPLRFAAGIQNKVLEAMAAGRPVVTTSLVNEGLGAEPGEEILLADTPAALAACLVELLSDEETRNQVGAAGRRFVTRKFSWDHAGRRMSEIEEYHL
jgi:glycosyltransferase involved in cell wall biosynthesis